MIVYMQVSTYLCVYFIYMWSTLWLQVLKSAVQINFIILITALAYK